MAILITQADYARRRGISKPSVSQAIKNGRVTLIDGKIDPELADEQWDKNTDHIKREAALSVKMRQAEYDRIQADANAGEYKASEYMIWKARRERAEALRAEQNQEFEAGNLYKKADADRAAKTIARLLRDQLLSIPARLAAELSAITDPAIIERNLSTEIRKALEAVERESSETDRD